MENQQIKVKAAIQATKVCSAATNSKQTHETLQLLEDLFPTRPSPDFEFSEGDSASGYDTPAGSFPMRVTYRPGGEGRHVTCFSIFAGFCKQFCVFPSAGIENLAFMPDLDSSVQIPPWLAEAELDSGTVAPSQRAQVRLPWTPSNLRRLAPLRISTRSTDSFMLADTPATQQSSHEDLPPPPTPPPPPPPDRFGDHM